jgi:molybdopterin molybdotransferase
VKSVDQHLAGILAAVRPLPARDLPLTDALGAVLAEPVTAPVDLPPFDNSAMDGYAVRAADLATASESGPVTLPVRGDIAAGARAGAGGPVGPGECVRIMTGAPMPAGADAVVPVEWTDGGAAVVRVSRPAEAGRYIRRRGEDVTAGEIVLRPGTRLGAAQVGLCAAVGRGAVAARPRPRVVVLSTGTELVEPGDPIEPGQIWDSNSFTLAAAVEEAGFVAERHGILADDPAHVLETIQAQAARADAIVTSGGVSMGVHDVVKEVLTGLGTMRFEQVAMRPGKPQGFGLIGDGTPIFTLPGNPVSAYVSFQVFVRPALRALLGVPQVEAGRPPASALSDQVVRATLTAPVRSPAGLRHFLRGRLAPKGGEAPPEPAGGSPDAPCDVTPVDGQGSHQLASLAAADGLIVVPEQVTELAQGARVDVMPLPWR